MNARSAVTRPSPELLERRQVAMPTVQPPAIRARSFPSRRKAKRGDGVPPRALELVQLMTLGTTEGSGPMSLPEAAAEMGIKIDTASRYFSHPKARAAYMHLLRDLREGDFAKNTHVAVSIRDDPRLVSAAGAKARIDSMRFLEHHPIDPRQTIPSAAVSPGIVVTVNVNRGPVEVDDTVIEVGSVGALPATV